MRQNFVDFNYLFTPKGCASVVKIINLVRAKNVCARQNGNYLLARYLWLVRYSGRTTICATNRVESGRISRTMVGTRQLSRDYELSFLKRHDNF